MIQFVVTPPKRIIQPLLALMFVMLSLNVAAQNETKNWFFGNYAGITFTSGTGTTTTGSAMSVSLGCTAVSDANGHLLFYSDGATVYNASHSVMANGTGLVGVGEQCCTILPKPGSTNLYYLFTVKSGTNSPGLFYSIIDMSLASGSGSVSIKNNLAYTATLQPVITAGRHCNGTDFWIVSAANGGILACSVTASGVGTPIYSYLNTHINRCIKLSPNSRKLAGTSYVDQNAGYYPNGYHTLDFYLGDFDNSTGSITATTYSGSTNSSHTFLLEETGYGVEFSNQTNYAYCSYIRHLEQIDICTPSLSSEPTKAESSDHDTTFARTFQLAPDGKIYMAKPGRSYVSAIVNPNLPTTVCAVQPTAITLGTAVCHWGLPNIPDFYFEQKPAGSIGYSGLLNSCNSISFQPSAVCAASGYTIAGYDWNFGDPSSGAANTASVSFPVHTYSTSGQYTVSVVRYYAGCVVSTDTLRRVINITAPVLSFSTQQVPCAQNSVSVSVTGGSGNYSYTWSPSSKTTAVATFTNPGNYTVSVLDQSANCLVTRTTAVNVIQLSASASSSSLQCFGQSNATATVNVSGSLGPFTYSWSGSSQTTSVTNGLAGGSQSVVVTDVLNQCTVQTTFYVPQPVQLTITPSPSAYSACQGKTITMHAYPNGGVGAYTYSWSSGSSTTSETSSLPTGSYVYTVQVKDGNNCVATCTLPVTFFAYPQLTFTNAAVCPGDSAHVYVSGAPAYTWQPGQTNTNHIDLLPIASQVYTITGDNMGCASSGTVSVTVFPPPSLTVSPSQTLCSGSTFITSSTPGTLNQWHGPALLSTAKPSFTLYNVQPANAGTYTLNFADMNGCKDSAMVSLAVMLSPTPAIIGKTVICTGQSSTLQATGGVIYQWNNGSTSSIINANGSQSARYTVTVTDGYGCSATKSISVIVEKCTGLSGSSKSTQWKIYPNPSDGRIYVDGPPNTPVTLHIMDADGKLIRQINYQVSDPLNAVELTLPAGVYVVKIDLAGVTQMRERIVIGK